MWGAILPAWLLPPPSFSCISHDQEQCHFFLGCCWCVHTLPLRWERPFHFVHACVGTCARVAWEDVTPCFSCFGHPAWKIKGWGFCFFCVCVCLLKILTLEERGDQGIESQEERQGKMLLHTEYSLLSLLHTQDGVVHHHGLFQVSGRGGCLSSPHPRRLPASAPPPPPPPPPRGPPPPPPAGRCVPAVVFPSGSAGGQAGPARLL